MVRSKDMRIINNYYIINISSEQSPGYILHGEEQGHEDGEEHLHLQPRLL